MERCEKKGQMGEQNKIMLLQKMQMNQNTFKCEERMGMRQQQESTERWEWILVRNVGI